MRIDQYGCIVTHGEDPGHLGDSCAETSRYTLLHTAEAMLNPNAELRIPVIYQQALESFVSTHGFLRHPDAPFGPPRSLTSWRESDATADQVLPLLLACDLRGVGLADVIRSRLRSTWTVAPGHIAPPALMALVYGNVWLFKKLTEAQTLIFKIPWRWSDDERLKGKWWKFVRSEGSTADWLNYFCSIVWLKRKHGISIKFDREKCLSAVRSYYASQENSEWIVDQYERTIV